MMDSIAQTDQPRPPQYNLDVTFTLSDDFYQRMDAHVEKELEYAQKAWSKRLTDDEVLLVLDSMHRQLEMKVRSITDSQWDYSDTKVTVRVRTVEGDDEVSLPLSEDDEEHYAHVIISRPRNFYQVAYAHNPREHTQLLPELPGNFERLLIDLAATGVFYCVGAMRDGE